MTMNSNFNALKKALQALDVAFAPAAALDNTQRQQLASDLKNDENKRADILRKLNLSISKKAIDGATVFEQAKHNLEKQINESKNTIANKEREILSIDGEIKDKTVLLNKIKQIIKELENRQNTLQGEINNRGIIISVWKYLFGDPEREELGNVGLELIKKFKEKKDLVAQCDSLQIALDDCKKKQETTKQQITDERKRLNECEEKIKQLQKAITLENSIDHKMLLLTNCDNRILSAEHNRKEAKNKALHELDSICKAIRAEQPQMGKCQEANFGKAQQYSDMIAYGRLRLNYNAEWRGYIPRLIPFPVKAAIQYGTSPADREWLVNFIMRLFQCVPPGQIDLTVIDPIKLGDSLPDFQVLLKNKHPFPLQKILTRGDEIEEALNRHLLYIENLIQRVFISGISGWDDYNKRNPNNQLQYKVLIVFDLPEQFTDKSILYLTRLIEHGPRCGVLPLLAFNRKELDSRKYSTLIETLKKESWKNAEIYRHSSMTSALRFLTFTEEPEPSYPEKDLQHLFEYLSKIFADVSSFDGKLEDLFSGSAFWGGKTISEIKTNVGWTAEGNAPVPFYLGDMPSHVLLGGKTGSGKSNFIHVLIHSLCHQYSPDELSLYLLDYKEGTEFNIYANPLLPHARLVATESDIEYGITVLRHLNDELQRRSDLFKRARTPDYKDYRTNTPFPIPRILLIVDEFQKLFEGDHSSSAEAETIVNNLLRQGRSFGIHVMLSTQTIRGLKNQSIGQLVSNLGCRIALSCSTEDSALLLGNANWEASSLQSPPEGIINSDNGIKSANIVFNIPLAEKETRIRLQEKMLNEAKRRNMVLENKIFNGNVLPEVPDIHAFSSVCNQPGVPLYLGVRHDFDSLPFVIDISNHNLLIAGYAPAIRSGMLQGIFNSLRIKKDAEVPILFFAAKPDCKPAGIWPEVTLKDSSWDLTDFEQFISRDCEKIVMIDSFDYAGKIHPSAMGSYRKPGAPAIPYDVLKHCADTTSGSKCHVILFVENYRRFASSAKDLFSLFNYRIGFGLNEDDAGSFVNNGGFGKLRGIENSTKAVFSNYMTNELFMIRPFSNNVLI